jgi:hypothetical protein
MKTAFLLALLLALISTAAHADGINFNWGSICWTESPVANRTFACNTNNSSASYQWPMTMSFVLDTGFDDLVGIEVTVLGESVQLELPDWWKLGPTDCRPNAMTYTSDRSAYAGETCSDWTAGEAVDALSYAWTGNGVQVRAIATLPTPVDLAPGEWYAGTLTLKNGRTVGIGACSGCVHGFSWGLALVTCVGHDGHREYFSEKAPDGNQCLRWNDAPYRCGGPSCALCVHSAATTWGRVKTLYR